MRRNGAATHRQAAALGLLMVFVFEFFSVGSDGRRHPIERVTREIANFADAEKLARATLKHVTFDGKSADFCVIMDGLGQRLSDIRKFTETDS